MFYGECWGGKIRTPDIGIEKMSGWQALAPCEFGGFHRRVRRELAGKRSPFRRVDSAKPLKTLGVIALCQEF